MPSTTSKTFALLIGAAYCHRDPSSLEVDSPSCRIGSVENEKDVVLYDESSSADAIDAPQDTDVEIWWRNTPLNRMMHLSKVVHSEFYVKLTRGGADPVVIMINFCNDVKTTHFNRQYGLMGKWMPLNEGDLDLQEREYVSGEWIGWKNVQLFQETIRDTYSLPAIEENEDIQSFRDKLGDATAFGSSLDWGTSILKALLDSCEESRDQNYYEMKYSIKYKIDRASKKNCQHLSATALAFTLDKLGKMNKLPEDMQVTVDQLLSTLDVQSNSDWLSWFGNGVTSPAKIVRESWESILHPDQTADAVTIPGKVFQIPDGTYTGKRAHFNGKQVYIPNVYKGLVDPCKISTHNHKMYHVECLCKACQSGANGYTYANEWVGKIHLIEPLATFSNREEKKEYIERKEEQEADDHESKGCCILQ